MTSVVVKRYIKININPINFQNLRNIKVNILFSMSNNVFKIMDLFPIERIGQGRDLINGQWRRCKWWAICTIWWEVHPWAQKGESDPCPILN